MLSVKTEEIQRVADPETGHNNGMPSDQNPPREDADVTEPTTVSLPGPAEEHPYRITLAFELGVRGGRPLVELEPLVLCVCVCVCVFS